MKMFGFLMVTVAMLSCRSGVAETAYEPDMAQWSVVKIVQVGRDAMAAGDKAKARSLAEIAVARDSGYAEGWKLLGTLRLQAGDTNTAAQAFRTALLIAPRDPVINRELAWLLWNEDREKALANLDVLVQANLGDRDAVITRVLSQLAETGNETKALELYKRWKPGFTVSELGVTLFKGGRRLAAVAFLEAAWEVGDNRAGVALYLASIDSRRGKWSRMNACLKLVMDQAPGSLNEEQVELLWDCMLAVKVDAASEGIWRQLVARYPAEQEKRVALADRFEKAAASARRRNDGVTASFLYSQTMKLDPNRISWADWSLLEEQAGKPEAVSASLAALLPRALNPAVRDGMTARMAHYQGDLEAAVQGYRKSLAVSPDQLVLRVFLVRDLLASSKLEEARRELKAIDSLGKETFGRTQKDLAEFWFEVGDIPRANALDRTLLTQKSKALMAENELEAAYAVAVLAVTNDVENAEAWLQFGTVQARRQQYTESKAALEKSIILKPGNVNTFHELGWTLWALGEKTNACSAWGKALDQGVPDRVRFVRQIVGRMAEEGQKDLALERHAQWLPETTPLAAGMDFFKGGRMKAAEPFLVRAWETGADREWTGLYLGSARALNGVVAGTPQYFTAFIASGVATAAPADVALVVDALRVCSGIPGAVETLDSLAVALTNRPDQGVRVTDLYFAYGHDETQRANLSAALGLYEKGLERDPNRLIWPLAWKLSQRLNDEPRGFLLLSNLLDHTTSVAVRLGVTGKQSEIKGDFAAAITAYQASVDAEPGQADIHKFIFDCGVQLGDFERARREADWMALRVDEGAALLRDTMALMWTDLGEDEKALEVWQFLHLTFPDVPYYATEMAMAQYRTGKGAAAVETLVESLGRSPTVLGYESLVQILAALGRPADAVLKAQEGLSFAGSSSLRQSLAENLEMIATAEAPTATVAAAQACVVDDPGSTSQSLLLGRSLVACGRSEEAMDHHQALLGRNPLLAPSLVFLRDQELVARRPRHAIPYAERLAKARPWDDMAVRRYAMTLAEADGFSRAIRMLEPLAGRDEKSVTALLLYGDTTVHAYPGRNTTAQIGSHIACLASNGYSFVTKMPADPPKGKTVMILLVQPDRAVVEAVDVILQKYQASAVMVVDPRSLKTALPRMASPQRLAELRRTGRWQIGVTCPDLGAAVVRADGVKGNPLTHRILIKGEQETMESMRERVTGILSGAAANVGEGKAPVFYYPGGDYGQLSLDTDPAAMEALSNAVSRSFTTAFCRDDNGFVSSLPDPLRIPVKAVPPSWDLTALENHILQGNSVVRARLELAKLYYWHGQCEVASHWFRKAAEAGANPFEVTFNQGANAAIEGDLAQALEKSREAVKLAPADDPRPAVLLEKVTNMRRPTATLDATAWWDNEDRSYWAAGLSGEGPIRDWLRWEAGLKRHNWEQKGNGHERATSEDLGFLAYIAPEVWLEAGFQEWLMDTLPDETGWRARLRLPNPWLKGYVSLISRMEMMETVEALRKGITSHREGVETYSRLYDFWDCFADLSLTQRSDGNDTWWGNVRFLRRLKETPYIGVGYAGRFADSTTDVPEYWSPTELQQHQVYAALQGTGVKWGGQLSGQAGYAKERGTAWRYVVGGKVSGIYKMTQRLNLGANFQYQEGPIYNRTTVEAYLNLRW
ncbi:MAG: tetratricopeptide repeat protein [bacterium]